MRIMNICMAVTVLLLLLVQNVEARKPVAVKVGAGKAAVTYLEGESRFLSAEQTDWAALEVGRELKGGDQVKTGPDAIMELSLPDGTMVRFADNTHFRIVSLNVSEDLSGRDVKVDLALGRAWANVSRALGVQAGFELSCENAVAGVRGTTYRMNVAENQSATVKVYEGQVAVKGAAKKVFDAPKAAGPPSRVEGPTPVPGPRQVTMEEWTYLLGKMQQIQISADGSAESPRDFTEAEDLNEWVEWNKSRDASTAAFRE